VLCGFSLATCGASGHEPSLLVQDTGNDDYDEGHSNNEWGGDSHESIGSFQPIDRSQVDRDFDDGAPLRPPNHRKEKIQNASTKVQVQASSIQSREYLCAVSTAEEAESWVVALRWAAEHRTVVRYGNSAKRNEGIGGNASLSSAAFPNTTESLIRNMVSSEEPIRPGRDQTVGRVSDNVNDIESDKSKNASKRSSESSEGNSGGESSTQKDSVDSKASLNSLLTEPDGWCKTEKGTKKKADDINEETWVKAAPEPSLFPELDTDSEAEADTQGPSRDKSIPPAPLLSPPAPSLPKKQPSSPVSATIVVTKVSKFRLPQSALVGSYYKGHDTDKNIPWFPFHFPLPGDNLVLQYEIQLLLLKNCTPLSETSVRPDSVEERTIFKSMLDVLVLVRDLMSELDAEEHGDLTEEGREHDQSTPTRTGRSSLLQPDETFLFLEDIESKLLSCLGTDIISGSAPAAGKPSTSVAAKGSITELLSETLALVDVVDSVMRKLSKDRNICSSRHFQDFLCLHSTHHHQSSSLSAIPNSRITPTTVSDEVDAEQLVKKWLAQMDPPSTTSKIQLILALSLRHNLGGPMVSLMAVWTITRLASMVWFMISGANITISIPLETYATLLVLAFFIGNNNRVSSRSRYSTEHLGKRRRKGRHIPSPVTVDQSNGDKFFEETIPVVDDDHSTVAEDEGSESESHDGTFTVESSTLSSPLPLFPANRGITCWSKPDHNIFMVRSASYLKDRIKSPSSPAVFQCRGVDVWITDNAERNIARHPSVLGGKLDEEDTFIVNFLLPFSNFVAYFTVPPIEEMPANVANVWSKFVKGDQQYRDGKLKLLPVVVDGPWIVKKAVGPGTSPAMIGRDLPLQYYFTEPTATKKGVYEVDVLVTASRIARGILNVVKGHTKSLTIAFAFIIEASEEAQLPETVLCAFQVHSLHLEDCPNLPDCYPDG